MNLDTGARRTIARSTSGAFEAPKFLPDGERISFVYRANDAAWNDGLRVQDIASGQVQHVVRTPIWLEYAWNTSGTQVAYIHYAAYDFTLNNSTVWVHDMVTGGDTRVGDNSQ